MKSGMQETATALIAATNAFDVDTALALFAIDTMIDDPSTGHRFEGRAGVRDYVERFFVGYHTVTRILSLEEMGANRARLRVDFTGGFGHEIGHLDLTIDAAGLITRIDADLE
ncbi:SnoaL-like domain protein (plasmid) [Pseudosulfitobacter pseudonitzschiae]|uniref:SnoaL-like domain protein n=2 Tax=Rhodobacterales TaxID=204455 RepID=A0A221K816_9RHOB|nr:SnoaL-like domain protein [Pseudosulfitobacter pseudonitzschiae]